MEKLKNLLNVNINPFKLFMKYMINQYLGKYLEIKDFNFDYMMNTGFSNIKIIPNTLNFFLSDKNIQIHEGVIGEIKIDYSITKKKINIYLKNINLTLYRNYQCMNIYKNEKKENITVRRRKESLPQNIIIEDDIEELNNNFKKSFINIEERDSFIVNWIKEMEINLEIENLEIKFTTAIPSRFKSLPSFDINIEKISVNKKTNIDDLFNLDFILKKFLVKIDDRILLKNKNFNFIKSSIAFSYKNNKIQDLLVNLDIDNLAIFLNDHNLLYIIELLTFYDNIFLISKIIEILRNNISNFNYTDFNEYIHIINKNINNNNNENNENNEDMESDDNLKKDIFNLNNISYKLKFNGIHIILVDLKIEDYDKCIWIKEGNDPLIFDISEILEKKWYYQLNINNIEMDTNNILLIKDFEFFTIKNEINNICLNNSFSKVDVMHSSFLDSTFNRSFQSNINDISYEHKYIIHITKNDDYGIIIDFTKKKMKISFDNIKIDLDWFFLQYHIEYLFKDNNIIKDKIFSFYKSYKKGFQKYGSENFLILEKIFYFNHLSQQNFEEILDVIKNISKDSINTFINFEFPNLDINIKNFNILFNIQKIGINKLLDINFDFNCELNQINKSYLNIKKLKIDLMDNELNFIIDLINIEYFKGILNFKIDNINNIMMFSTFEKLTNYSNFEELFVLCKNLNLNSINLFIKYIEKIQFLNSYNENSYEIFKNLISIYNDIIYKGLELKDIKFEINKTSIYIKVDKNDKRFIKEKLEEFDDWEVIDDFDDDIKNLGQYNKQSEEKDINLLYLSINSLILEYMNFKIYKFKVSNLSIKILDNLLSTQFNFTLVDKSLIFNKLKVNVDIIKICNEIDKILSLISLIKTNFINNNNNKNIKKFEWFNNIKIENMNIFINYFVYSFNLNIYNNTVNFNEYGFKLNIEKLSLLYLINYNEILKNTKIIEIINLNFDNKFLTLSDVNINLNDNILKIIIEIWNFIKNKIDFNKLSFIIKDNNDNNNGLIGAKLKNIESDFNFGEEFDELDNLENFINNNNNINYQDLLTLLPFEYLIYKFLNIKIENWKCNYLDKNLKLEIEILLNNLNYFYYNQTSESNILLINKFLIIDKNKLSNSEYILKHENNFLTFVLNYNKNHVVSSLFKLSNKIDIFIHEIHLDLIKNIIDIISDVDIINSTNDEQPNYDFIIDIIKVNVININFKSDSKHLINIFSIIPDINIILDELIILNFKGNIFEKLKNDYTKEFIKNLKKIVIENKLNLPIITSVINVFNLFFSFIKLENNTNINNNLKNLLKNCILDLKRTKKLGEKTVNELINIFKITKNYFLPYFQNN